MIEKFEDERFRHELVPLLFLFYACLSSAIESIVSQVLPSRHAVRLLLFCVLGLISSEREGTTRYATCATWTTAQCSFHLAEELSTI